MMAVTCRKGKRYGYCATIGRFPDIGEEQTDRKYMIKLILSAVLLLLPFLLPAKEEDGSHIVKWIRLDDGLSNNFIMSIDIDRHGIIWIGTEEGMNRFDGVSVNRFMKYSGQIPGNALNKVIADKNHDRVWIATQRDGLAYYDWSLGESGCFSRDSTDVSLPSNEITSVSQDDEGNIWFSTYTEGIGMYDCDDGSMKYFNAGNVSGMPGYKIRSFVIGNDKKIYVAYYGAGMAVVDPGNMTATRYIHNPDDPGSLPSNEIGSIYKDKNGNIWIGTRKGLALFRHVTNDFTIFSSQNSNLPDGLIFSILETSDNRILVSPDFNGVWEMSLEPSSGPGSFSPVLETADIKNTGFRAMCEDRFGNLWLGSYGNGLMFISHDKHSFCQTTYPDISDKNVTSLIFLKSGKMMAGTEGGGLVLLDTEMKAVAEARQSLPDKTVLSIAADDCGRCWTGTFNGGISVTDSSLNKLATVDIREVRGFCEHRDTMWAASGLSGLYAVDKNTLRVLHRYSSPQFFPDNYLKSVCVDTFGRLWVGTFRSGLFIFSGKMEKTAEFNTSDGLPSNTINSIVQDADGCMWVATDEGLLHFKAGGNISCDKIWSAKDGMSSESIKAVVIDRNDDVWFSTSCSICHLDSRTGKITEYGTRNGILPGNYSSNAAFLRNDGMISFGSTEGIVSFFPERVSNGGIWPSAYFSEMQIFDTKDPAAGKNTMIFLTGKDMIKLRHFQNNFKISFAADDYSFADIIEYSYKVEGKGNDSNWYLLKNSNSVSFHQLRPGNYTLKIRARLGNSEWPDDENSLKIRIMPPFYATKAAFAIYVFLTMLLIYAVISLYISKVTKENEAELDKERVLQIREINEERLRFYTNIAHELKTPLTLILGPIEDLVGDTSLQMSAREKILTAHKNANLLLNLIDKLLNFRKTETNNMTFKPSYGDLSKFVRDIGVIFSDSNTNKETFIKLDIEKGVLADFDQDIITAVLNNLLSNALKYTPSGLIILCLKTVADNASGLIYADISVSDTGIGIEPACQDKIFDRYYRISGRHQAQGIGIGLALVKSLVQLHDGEISVKSEKGKGSIFTVRIPIDKIYAETSAANSAEEHEEADNSRLSVVIAEDNDGIREYISSSLSDTYEVYTAQNGSEAYWLVRSHMPDIIISDIMMPVMDGLKLCGKIKNDMRYSHIPFILLTAKDSIEDRNCGYEAGADSYIPKPFTCGMLKTRMKNLIESRRKQTNLFAKSADYDKAIADFRKSASPLDSEFLNKVTKYIEDNIGSEDLDIGSLAANMNMSISSLYRKMKSLVGISAIEYIRKIKMKTAAKMLASGEYNISETAWNVGMNSMTHFRQYFKAEYGMSPSEFRRLSRQDTASPA